MNIQGYDVLNTLAETPFLNQRALADACGYSLGTINRSLKELVEAGYVDEKSRLTQKSMAEIEDKRPRRAIILAAGFGMRMVPINTETPKGLLEVNGEPLIERAIRQL